MELAERLLDGDVRALARAISMVEDRSEALPELLSAVRGRAGQAHVVGLTGPPGSGKSTLADGVVERWRALDRDVGVLAVDPSSPFSGGAILGDRVRMQGHALDEGVFIRSMATRGHLGGLALATPEAVRVLAAAGMPIVLIETVGVGQVEVEVARSADTTVVVVNPGWGDSIQANKAGLLEIADIFVINKADRPGAAETRRDLDNMLDMTSTMGEWRPPIVPTVAATGEGVAQLWTVIGDHRAYLERSGELADRRRRRVLDQLSEVLIRRVEARVHQLEWGRAYERIRDAVIAGDVDPYGAADELLGKLGL
jgi:LAO/AO transport system kinase